MSTGFSKIQTALFRGVQAVRRIRNHKPQHQQRQLNIPNRKLIAFKDSVMPKEPTF
jgi:hypothetical protein